MKPMVAILPFVAVLAAPSVVFAARPVGRPLPPAALARRTPAPAAGANELPSGVDAGWWAKTQAEIARSEYRLAFEPNPSMPGLGASWQAPNRAQGLRTYFSDDGIALVPRTGSAEEWSARIATVGIARGDAFHRFGDGTTSVSEERFAVRRDLLDEEYRNTPDGVTIRWVLAAFPDAGEGAVEMRLAVSGCAQTVIDGNRLAFRQPGVVDRLGLTILGVKDAAGRTVPFSLRGAPIDGGSGAAVVFEAAEMAWPVEIQAVATTANFSATGIASNDAFGFSVAPAGDVNGDGYADVVVGAPFYDSLAGTDSGAAWVYYGSATGIQASSPAPTAMVLNGINSYPDQNFGSAVATAGDFNADGYDDVIVGGCECFRDPLSGYAPNPGLVRIYRGSSSGLLTGTWWEYVGSQSGSGADWDYGDAVGWAVAPIGDANCDGYMDVVVGAWGWSNGHEDEGRVAVLQGRGTVGTIANPDWSYEADADYAYLGSSVAGAGHLDGTNQTDFVSGGTGWDAGKGGVWAFLSATSSCPGGTVSFTTASNWAPFTPGDAQQDVADPWDAGSYFGNSVASWGDVDGGSSGYTDIFVGAPGHNDGGTDNGRVGLYLGGASAPSTTPAWQRSGASGTELGHAVGLAGDVNGDGYADLVASAWLETVTNSNDGKVELYLGGSTPDGTPDWTFSPSAAGGAQTGSAVFTAGDVNGDGLSDLLVSAHQWDSPAADTGAFWVFHGTPFGIAPALGWNADENQTGNGEAPQFGYSLDLAGDVNGDGFTDAVVGAPGFDSGSDDEGKVYLYLGSQAGLASTPVWTKDACAGACAGTKLGFSVSAGGDIDGDGYADVIVAAPFYSSGQTQEGAVWVYYGDASAAMSRSWFLEGNNGGESGVRGANFGWSTSGLGDFNGDGFTDIAIGAPGWSEGGAQKGAIFVYYGSGNGNGLRSDADNNNSLLVDFKIVGSSANWNLGTAVATVGDYDGDGFTDFAASAPGYTNASLCGGGPCFGQVLVYRGGSSGLGLSAAVTIRGDQSGAEYGAVLSGAGDVNGDGYSDLAIGSPGWDASGPIVDAGRVQVYQGPSLATASWTVAGTQAGARFGDSISGTGDADGDGNSDLAVGQPLWDGGETDEGRVHVFAGSVTGLSTTAAVTIEGNVAGAKFGTAVSTVGDVDADTMVDLLVGGPGYATNQGRAWLIDLAESPGLARRPRQLRYGTTVPIPAFGLTSAASDFAAKAFTVRAVPRSAFGRVRTAFDLENKLYGTLLNGTSISSIGYQENWNGSAWIENIISPTGLGENAIYHWRARLRHDPKRAPFATRYPLANPIANTNGRWYTNPRNGEQEADLRTRVVGALGISQSADQTAITENEVVTFTITVANTGADARNVMIWDRVLTSSGSYLTTETVTLTAGSGTCRLTSIPNPPSLSGASNCPTAPATAFCFLPLLGAGQSAVMQVTGRAAATLPSSSLTGYSRASVLSDVVESVSPAYSNNCTQTSLTVRPPGIGGHIWFDTDRDGCQDGGEALYLAGDLSVALFNSSAVQIQTALSDGAGSFAFDGLSRGGVYSVRFALPAGNYLWTPNRNFACPGTVDFYDSDVYPADNLGTPSFDEEGWTDTFTLNNSYDKFKWDAGLVVCQSPSQATAIGTVDEIGGNNDVKLHWTDGNPTYLRTGWNVYRSTTADGTYTKIGSNVTDQDGGTSGIQWTDTTGSPTGDYFYLTTAWDQLCGLEGP